AAQPFLNLLATLGLPAEEAAERLGRRRVAVFGLEGHGAHVAAALADCGLGGVTLVDPYPCEAANLGLMPALGRDALGRPRQLALQDALGAHGALTPLSVPAEEVNREAVDAV